MNDVESLNMKKKIDNKTSKVKCSKTSTKNWYDVIVTREMLDADESTLSDTDKKAVYEHKHFRQMLDERLDTTNKTLRELCPILHSGDEKNMIPSPGWIAPIEKLCYELEYLNNEFAKYGIHVEADQTKSKFGTLRFYYNVVVHYSKTIRVVSFPFKCVSDFIFKHVDFRQKNFIYKPAYLSIEWTEISKNEYKNKLNAFGTKLQNGVVVNFVDFNKSAGYEDILTGETAYFDLKNNRVDPRWNIMFMHDKKNNKFYRSNVVYHSQNSQYLPTRFKALYRFAKTFRRIAVSIESHDFSPSRKKCMMHEVFRNKVDELVHKCEADCYDLCEDCGTNISKNRCTTSGWIAYVCKKCAIASGAEYVDADGKMFKKTKSH